MRVKLYLSGALGYCLCEFLNWSCPAWHVGFPTILYRPEKPGRKCNLQKYLTREDDQKSISSISAASPYQHTYVDLLNAKLISPLRSSRLILNGIRFDS